MDEVKLKKKQKRNDADTQGFPPLRHFVVTEKQLTQNTFSL